MDFTFKSNILQVYGDPVDRYEIQNVDVIHFILKDHALFHSEVNLGLYTSVINYLNTFLML